MSEAKAKISVLFFGNLCAIVAAGLFALLFFSGLANTYISDEWSIADRFFTSSWNSLTLFLQQLWHNHNEHRNVLPNLFFFLNGYFDGYTPWRLCTLSLIISLTAYGLFQKQLYIPTSSKVFRFLYPALYALFFFSFGQKSNWTIGFYILWPLAILGYVIFCLGLAQRKRALTWTGFLITYFTSTVWIPLILPWYLSYLVEAKKEKDFATQENDIKKIIRHYTGRTSAYCFFTVLILWVLAHAYMRNLLNSKPVGVELSVLQMFGISVQFLGAPFQWIESQIAWFLGLLCSGGSLYWIYKSFQKTRTAQESTASEKFEFYFLLSGLGFVALTAYGRHPGWQWSDNTPDRYNALVAPLWLILISKSLQITQNKSYFKIIAIAATIVLTLQIVITNIKALKHEHWLQEAQIKSDLCLRENLNNELPDEMAQSCTNLIYPNFSELKPAALRLKTKGHYPLRN